MRAASIALGNTTNGTARFTSAVCRDNGVPGLRPQYHAKYYAAFILDPDGYNIEAVCHRRQQ